MNRQNVITEFEKMLISKGLQPNSSYLPILEKEAKVMVLKRGEWLVRQGQICRHLYFVAKGMARYYYGTEERELSTWFSFSGDFATVFDSFYLQIPSRETIEIMEETTVLAIAKTTLEKMLSIDASWERTGRLLTIQYAIQLEDRIHLLHQSMNATEKYEYLLERHPRIIQHIPNKYIASYLGISRETLSRIRSKYTVN